MKNRFLLFALLSSLSCWAQESTIEGIWVGHYQTQRAFEGKLTIEIEKVEAVWRLTLISSNEHYPSEEPEETVAYYINEDLIYWTLNWGPNQVKFIGKIEGDFMVGEIKGQQKGAKVHFKGHWMAVKESARKR